MKKEIEIYRQSFGVEEAFEKLLFRTKPVTLKVQNTTVAQLFLLPCNIVKNGESFAANYIFAAATDEKHRGKGYMSRLINRVISDTKEILILRPATQSLIDFYKRFSFKAFTGTDCEKPHLYVEPLGNFKALSQNDDKTNDGEFTLMELNSPIDLNGLYFPFTMP